jgi:molybdopterin synthase sulfur carrier subunit
MTTLLYFAWVREMVGTDSEALALPADITTVSALLDWLAARSPGHAAALADRSRIRIAVDQAFATTATPLNSPREIAIFPPVTGG